VRDLEEISFERMATRLHLCANDVNSGLFQVDGNILLIEYAAAMR